MTGRLYLLLFSFLVLSLVVAGCITYSVGDVSYGAGNLTITIGNSASPADVGIQVTVYALDAFGQHELGTSGTTATLTRGENTLSLPLHLDPGRYKIYVYITTNGQRETAVIRDITV